MQDMRNQPYIWYNEHNTLPDAKPRSGKCFTEIETYFPKITIE